MSKNTTKDVRVSTNGESSSNSDSDSESSNEEMLKI